MSYKFLKSNNQKLISRLKKYSNIVLFSRREQDLIEKMNSNKYLPIQLNNNINKKKDKKDINKNPSKTLNTISSFKSILDFLKIEPGSFSPKNKDIKIKTIYPYNLTLDNTVNEKMKKFKRNKIFSSNDIKKEQKNILNVNILNNKNDKRFNTISNSNSNNNMLYIKEKDDTINLLKEIEINNFKNEKKINKKIISLLNTKQKKFRVQKYSIQDIINQARYIKVYLFNQNIKKEISTRMQEKYDNKLEYLEEKINSLKIGTDLYDIKFNNKLNEYMKFISYYKDEEKKNCDILENNIRQMKKEIMVLQNKIKREELDKNNILRWIYLQIRMKEKKLTLPEYYKKIIETNVKRNFARRKTISTEINNFKNIKDPKKTFYVHKYNFSSLGGDSSKNLVFVNSKNSNNNNNNDDSKKIKNRIYRNYSISKVKKNSNKNVQNAENNIHNTIENYNHIINFEENNIGNKALQKIHKNIDDTGIDGYEINRITQYKLFLVYETPEEFEDRLNEIEFENIQLINEFNILQKNLNRLRMQYDIILEERNEHDINTINKIKLREYELKEIIKTNELLKNQISYLKDKKPNTNISNNFLYKYRNAHQSINNIDNNNIYHFTISKDIYIRIENIYNLIKKHFSKKKEKKKKLNNKKEDVIHMLTYIENNIDKLNNKFRVYNNNDYKNYELMRKLKNDIEKRHKIEKSEMLRMKEKEKFFKFREEIESKMNRIIFIQKRKIDTDYNLNNIGKNINYNSHFEKQGEPNFEDFINFENKI